MSIYSEPESFYNGPHSLPFLDAWGFDDGGWWEPPRDAE